MAFLDGNYVVTHDPRAIGLEDCVFTLNQIKGALTRQGNESLPEGMLFKLQGTRKFYTIKNRKLKHTTASTRRKMSEEI